MGVLQLIRAPGDRRLYTFDGVGSLRLTGWASRDATAEAGGEVWRITRRGFWHRVIQATDRRGTVVGEYTGRSRGGGALRWSSRAFALRRDGFWRERYLLVEGSGVRATIAGRSWGRRPVTVTADDVAGLDPGLLLFAAFVVRTLAVDAAAAAS